MEWETLVRPCWCTMYTHVDRTWIQLHVTEHRHTGGTETARVVVFFSPQISKTILKLFPKVEATVSLFGCFECVCHRCVGVCVCANPTDVDLHNSARSHGSKTNWPAEEHELIRNWGGSADGGGWLRSWMTTGVQISGIINYAKCV